MASDRHDQPLPNDGEPAPGFPIDDVFEFLSPDPEPPPCDCFAPPAEPCECYCLHCGRLFMSDQIWFQRVINSRDGLTGFWMCPTPNCDGMGFTFDIFPTDPTHPANQDALIFDDGGDDSAESAFEPAGQKEYDPAEPEYAALDEEAEEDLDGEEWKYGVTPGDALFEPEWRVQARRAREEEQQRRFDEPDRRPREIDLSQGEQGFDEAHFDDDLPF